MVDQETCPTEQTGQKETKYSTTVANADKDYYITWDIL